MTIEALAEKINELETKLSFQEDTIAQLNDIVTKQDQIIRKMERRFSLIGEKIEDMESQMPNKPFDPVDEIPPHF